MNAQDMLTQLATIAELAIALLFVFGLADISTRRSSQRSSSQVITAPAPQAAVSSEVVVDSVKSEPVIDSADSASEIVIESIAPTPAIDDPWTIDEVTVVQVFSTPQLAIVHSNVLSLPATQPLLCLPSVQPALAPQAAQPTPTPKPWQCSSKGNSQPTQTTQLRRECAAKGVKWRNANGHNKHMSLQQMRQALQAIAA